MIAVSGGKCVPCASYQTFGSQELSDGIIRSLQAHGVRACLLANHGAICYDSSLAKAVHLAAEVETLAKQYSVALSMGPPRLLDGLRCRVAPV